MSLRKILNQQIAKRESSAVVLLYDAMNTRDRNDVKTEVL